jgi:hypothetical protein
MLLPTLATALLALPAGETWTVISLLPPGADTSLPRTTYSGIQAGNVGFGGALGPGYWLNGNPNSWQSLGSYPDGAWCEEHWGTAFAGYTIRIDAFGDDFAEAVLWELNSGIVETSLHPPGAIQSRAEAVHGFEQGGSVAFTENDNRAALWSGSAASLIDLHPAGAGDSYVLGMGPGQQVGYATLPFSHACIWSGSPESFVDLHPVNQGLENLLASQGAQTDGTTQVGWIIFENGLITDHPALWQGTPESMVDLLPTGWRDGKALGVADGRQAGYARRSLGTAFDDDYRALLWSGSAEDRVDLGAILPPGQFERSFAYDVWTEGSHWYVIGAAVRTGGGLEPLLWTAPIVKAQEVVRLGTPPNPNAFLPGVTSGPVLGQTWDPVIDHASFVPDAVLDLLIVSGQPTNLPIPGSGTLLCLPGDLPIEFSSPGTPFAVGVPGNDSLCGLELCSQGISINAAGVAVGANALDLTLGLE